MILLGLVPTSFERLVLKLVRIPTYVAGLTDGDGGSNPSPLTAVHSVSWTISPNEDLSENGNAGCFFCLFPNLVSLVADLFGGSWKKLFPVEKFGGPIPPITCGPNLESYKKAVGLSRGFDVPAYKKRHL